MALSGRIPSGHCSLLYPRRPHLLRAKPEAMQDLRVSSSLLRFRGPAGPGPAPEWPNEQQHANNWRLDRYGHASQEQPGFPGGSGAYGGQAAGAAPPPPRQQPAVFFTAGSLSMPDSSPSRDTRRESLSPSGSSLGMPAAHSAPAPPTFAPQPQHRQPPAHFAPGDSQLEAHAQQLEQHNASLAQQCQELQVCVCVCVPAWQQAASIAQAAPGRKCGPRALCTCKSTAALRQF